MADQFFGFAAALAAPLVGVLGFTIWGDHWTGHSYMLNCVKGCVATLFFIATYGIAALISPLAGWDTSLDRFTFQVIGWLLVSSLLGIVIGDTCWLQAQQLLGTRSVVLIDALKPWLSAFWGSVFLAEAPTWGWGGAVLTWLAVLCVECSKPAAKEPAAKEPAAEPEGTEMADSFAASSARQPAQRNGDELALNGSADSSTHQPRVSEVFQATLARQCKGYVCASVNVLLDSLGSLITKQHGRALHPWEIAGVRFGGAAVLMLLSVGAARLAAHLRPDTIARACGTPIARAGGAPQFYQWPVLDRRAMCWIVVAILLTTYLASLFSNYALFEIDLLFVSTLGSLSPIWSLIIGRCRGERATLHEWLGAFLAVVGVVVLICGSTTRLS
jgi:drug/metabolite transporter (DMT)-like permease